MTEPSTADPNGRDRHGRFTAGNRIGRGNPHAKRAAQLRAALFREVTPADLRRLVRCMVEAAAGGDVPAARLVLEYSLGKPAEHDFIERLEALEAEVANGTD